MVLLVQTIITLLTFAAASFYFLIGKGTAIAGYHIIFALGIMPLILAAIAYFVPVLTRSGKTGRWIGLIPLVALMGGFMVVLSFTFPLLTSSMHYFGAITSGCAVAIISFWAIHLRAKPSVRPTLVWTGI